MIYLSHLTLLCLRKNEFKILFWKLYLTLPPLIGWAHGAERDCRRKKDKLLYNLILRAICISAHDSVYGVCQPHAKYAYPIIPLARMTAKKEQESEKGKCPVGWSIDTTWSRVQAQRITISPGVLSLYKV